MPREKKHLQNFPSRFCIQAVEEFYNGAVAALGFIKIYFTMQLFF